MKTIETFAKQLFGPKPQSEISGHEATVTQLHSGQTYGELPYTIHLFDVARIASKGLTPTISPYRDVLRFFALYHDAIEDTSLTLEKFIDSLMLKGVDEKGCLFATKVLTLLTDPIAETRKERKALLKALWEETRTISRSKVVDAPVYEAAIVVATRVKLADRLAHLERIDSMLAQYSTTSKDERKKAKSLLKMYSKEHEDFMTMVCPEEHELKSEITKLFSLLTKYT
jgi:hypothetical protein